MNTLKQNGQMTIEMMLIIIIGLASSLALSKTAKEGKWMESIVSGPWKPLQAMIENGVWNPGEAKTLHPHSLKRHGSYDADPVPGDGTNSEEGSQ